MCLCTYKIYILYYLDSLAFSTKRVKKTSELVFLFWKSFFLRIKHYEFCLDIEEIAGEKKKIWRRLNEKYWINRLG